MANTITTFPTVYLDAIDEVLAGATYANAYNVQGAEFVGGRQVSVPDISFGESAAPDAYDRFKTEGSVSIGRTTYTLDHDVQKVFYVDATEASDEPAIEATKVVSEYERAVFGPYIDKDFFAKALANAKATASETLTAATVKAAIRKARSQFTAAGLSGGSIYMSSDAVGFLEDATNREWANETTLVDSIGSYDGLSVYEVPSDILGTGVNFIAIAGGTSTIRYVTKRAAAYEFAPGQHTQGDGWLEQFRWVFGTLVYKNKKPGVYASKASA